MNIENKAILITGANRGIGRALVDEALRRGVKKVYAGTRRALEVADKRVTPLSLDVTDARQVQQAVEQVDSLDVLINNAGIAIYDDLTNFEVIEKHLAVNFLGLLRVTHGFLPALRRSHGAIVNNLSLVGLAALPIIPAYSLFEGGCVQHDAVTQSALGRPKHKSPRRGFGPGRHRYEPRVRDTKGLARVRGGGHFRWPGKRPRRDLP